MTAPSDLDYLLDKVTELPFLPKAAINIISSIEDENSTMDSIVAQIKTDTGLSSNILKMANSHLFSRYGGISSLSNAVMLIGMDRIRQMICLAGMHNPTTSLDLTLNYDHFCKHSTAVGVCCSVLVSHFQHLRQSIHPDIAFVAGAMHDIGKLALAMAAPERFKQMHDYTTQHQCHELDAEMKIFGFNHTDFGAAIAKKWDFPEKLQLAISQHHHPDQEPHAKLADLVHLSHILCYALDLHFRPARFPRFSPQSLFRLNITLEQIAPCFPVIECEFFEAERMLTRA